MKVKLYKSRPQKFYQVKQLKENSTENSPEKNFKEDLQLNQLWNISTKQKKKKKKKKEKKNTQILKTTLSDKFLQIAQNFQHFIFSIPFFFRFFL